jgi:modification methylase
MTPYYEQDGITIYHGDCRDVLPLLPLVDLVFTSPPYNKNRRFDGTWQGIVTETCKGSRFRGGYGVHTDDMPMPEYESWQRDTLRALWGVLSDDGAIYYNHKPRIINGELWMPTTLNPGLPLRQIVIWDTGAGINFMPGAYIPAHEWIMLFARPSFRFVERRASALSDVWRFHPASTKDHPAPFPIELAQRAISSTNAAVVLDPFMGSGSTLLAAQREGRCAIGIELDEQHCETAVRRLSQAVMPLEVVA